jgi:hypothetical protein
VNVHKSTVHGGDNCKQSHDLGSRFKWTRTRTALHDSKGKHALVASIRFAGLRSLLLWLHVLLTVPMYLSCNLVMPQVQATGSGFIRLSPPGKLMTVNLIKVLKILEAISRVRYGKKSAALTSVERGYFCIRVSSPRCISRKDFRIC